MGAPQQPGGLFGSREWVVPRAQCQYRRQDFSQLPARQRPAAARLAVARFEPSPGSRTHIAWLDGVAHYWIWTSPDGAEGDYRRWIPETCLLAPPVGDGVRLLGLSQGVEGQVWQDGQLQASQWWPHPPDAQAWQYFVRSAGHDPQDALPPSEPTRQGWLAAPWGEARQGLAIDAQAGERIAWTGAMLLFVFALGWQVSGLVRWHLASTAESARLEAARSAAAPLLDARERAELALSRIDHLLVLQRGTSDYTLMADVAEALPEGAQLAGWSRDPSRLRILIRTAEADPRKFISSFAGLPRLSNVTATPTGGGNMLLEIVLPDDGRQEGGE